MIKLHNTLGRKLEDFKPLQDRQVKLYTCGPTVYNYYHVGNLRNAVFNDSLRRMLEASGTEVKHVMNITDVGHLSGEDSDGDEDKLEAGAKREGKSVEEIADYYTEAFKKDMAALNVAPPNGYKGEKDSYARATDFINEQIDIVSKLIAGGFAYQTKQAIYFDVTKLADYGKLTGQSLADKEVGVRSDVITDDEKRNPHDFALWFFTTGHFKDHEMRWPSPWGEGFPGWHLECSAIIHATLGEPIDIHTGGVDHIGTHHTNEIAQSEAAFGKALANYWLHNEFLMVEGQRMAKSAGNFYRLQDLVEKGYHPLALRLLYLQSHYRSQMNFTWDALDAAQVYLSRLYAWADLAHQPELGHKKRAGDTYEQVYERILKHMQNDLNSPEALAELSKLIDESESSGVDTKKFMTLLHKLDALFALGLSQRSDISGDAKFLISEREVARQANDWVKSDELRTRLNQLGIEVKDTSHGPVWSQEI